MVTIVQIGSGWPILGPTHPTIRKINEEIKKNEQCKIVYNFAKNLIDLTT